MPVTLEEKSDLLRVKLDGNPSRSEYERSIPELEEAIEEHHLTRILVELNDFRGWDLSSRWDREEFEVKTFDEVEKVAFIGDGSWSRWMDGFSRPFRKAAIRFFGERECRKAREWLSRSR